MKYVEDYYIIYQYQNPNLKFVKRVYIATDEPSVLRDAHIKYELFLIIFLKKYLFISKDIQIMCFMVIQLLHNLLNLKQDMEHNH
jgi:Alpha-(1,6)-fucosyltransferase N- and catalytic domains